MVEPVPQENPEQNDAEESSGEEVTMEEYLLYSARAGEIEGI